MGAGDFRFLIWSLDRGVKNEACAKSSMVRTSAQAAEDVKDPRKHRYFSEFTLSCAAYAVLRMRG